jgi:tRNA threonylcarbamoyladenosine biosynthesis protein TsaB
MILAVDTATQSASVALYDESGIVEERTWRSANRHSVETMPVVADMLARQGRGWGALTGVAVAQGPGSFTGLRIGMSVAKGLCLALEIPILAIPTLDITAYSAGDPGGPLLAVLEAGRRRICYNTYHFVDGLPVADGAMRASGIAEWQLVVSEPLVVVGEVGDELARLLQAHPQADMIALASRAYSLRRAGYLAELAWERLRQGPGDDLDQQEPLYIPTPRSGT